MTHHLFFIASPLASHTCTVIRESAIVNRQYTFQLFTIHVSRL